MKTRWTIFLTALLFAVADAAACVGCREPGQDTLAKESPTVMAGIAFSWSVLFMLVFALLIVGGMSFYIGKTCRRIERERSGQ
jgi:hypothetical protein